MVKSVLGVSRQGLRDWLFQRVSAIVMALYSVGLAGYLLFNSNMDFIDWHSLFSHTSMKIATILFIGSLLYHTWIGMWTIITDYVKITWLALLLHTIIFFTLIANFFWALTILWGV